MSVHVNHPRELTLEVKNALERLANAGIPLGNQSVLLRGVNDNVDTMKTLVHKLLRCRVRPYYLYQLDLIQGFVSPPSPGMERLWKSSRACAATRRVTASRNTSSMPPAAAARSRLTRTTCCTTTGEKVVIRNYEGKVFEYPEPTNYPASEAA